MFSNIVSVSHFVDRVINNYAEGEKINKIHIYFTINDIIRDSSYSNNLVIKPKFIHIDYENNETLNPMVYENFDKICEICCVYNDYGCYDRDAERELFIRVRENKNRSLKFIKSKQVYKLVIDCSELKEFTKNNKIIKYYDSSFMDATDNEINEHKQSGNYQKFDD